MLKERRVRIYVGKETGSIWKEFRENKEYERVLHSEGAEAR